VKPSISSILFFSGEYINMDYYNLTNNFKLINARNNSYDNYYKFVFIYSYDNSDLTRKEMDKQAVLIFHYITNISKKRII
jgi:hypothetical protein